MSHVELRSQPLHVLHERARERGLAGYRRLSRAELLTALDEAAAAGEEAPAGPERPGEQPPSAGEGAAAEQRRAGAGRRPAAGPTLVELAREDGLGLVTLRGASGGNTLALETLERLAEAAEELAGDEGVRVVAITAAGRIFSAGADLGAIAGLSGAEIARRGTAACARIEALPVPTLALLNGHVVGGALDLVLACDWRVALAGAKLRFIHNELGYSPPWGAAARIRSLLPPGRALSLFALCRTLSAAEALELGLVDEVVERGGQAALLEHGRTVARRAAHGGRAAVAASRRLLREALPLEEHECAFAELWDAAKLKATTEEEEARGAD